LDINGTLSIGTGTVDANGAFDATGGAVTFTGAGNLKLGGTVTSLGTFTKSTSTVTYDGGDQTVDNVDYSTLSFTGSTTGSTKTFADGITKIDNHISLTDDITLTGSSESAATIQVPTPGTTDSRIFLIDNASGKTINISKMTIKGGDISSLSSTASYGDGIYFSTGTLNLESVTVSGSKASYGGGIQVAGGVINIDKCTIKDNIATPNNGGGIRVGGSANATVVVTNSTFSGNSSVNYGGGFSSSSGNTITITNSTFSNNTSDGVGGGISLSSPSTLTSLTIANNHSDNDGGTSSIGGGLYFYAETHSVKNCIIANNYRGSGTSFYDDFGYYGDTTTDNGYNVIAYSNVAAIATGGFNNATTILYNTRYNTDITGYSSWTQGGVAVSGSLNLSSTLADNNTINGTQTLALTSGSFAIDAGSNAANGSVSIPSTDQRGASRKSDVDIGAYEWWDNDASLPVTLSTFTAQYINDIPILCWTTQSETSNAGWNIYRGETDIFEEAIQINLEMILGAGTTSEPIDYIYEDESELMENTEYWYWLESINYSGQTESYGPISLIIPEEGEEPGSPEIPGIYGLHQNYPNPFNPNTEISFIMKESCIGELSIYNVKGQKIKTIFSNLSIPRDELLIYNWNGKDESGKEVSTGVYYYKLRTTKGNYVRKMILLK